MILRNPSFRIALLITTALIAGACASTRYVKKAEKFEEAGLYEDAAYYYYLAVQEKNSNVDAKLGLLKNGQIKLNNRLKHVKEAYRDADYREVVYQYRDARSYYDKLALVGVNLDFPEIYETYYDEAKSDFLNKLYAEGVDKLNREEFAAALKIFEKIRGVDADFKDVQDKYIVARYEPLYRDAITYIENGLYRKAYYTFEEIISGAGSYRQVLSLKNEAREKATITILINDFSASQKTFDQQAAVIETRVKSRLLALNNPFIKLINASSVGTNIYKNGKIDMQAANMAGIKAVLNGKVIDLKKRQGKLKKQVQKAYLKELKKVTNSEGATVTQVHYKKTQYTRYTAENTAVIQVEFSLVSTENSEILVNDFLKLTNYDKVDYATYDGDKNKLVPGTWKNKMYDSDKDVVKDNYGDVNALRKLLKADRRLKPVSMLLDELLDESATRIVKKIDYYNPE